MPRRRPVNGPTVTQLLTTAFGVWVALFGPRPLKLVVLGWWWFP